MELFMPRYTDKRMLDFKSIQGYTPMEQEEFSKGLAQVKHKYLPAARSALILLYYSGCRPIEALELERISFRKQGGKLWIVFPAKKGGESGTLMFSLKNPHIKELAEFALAAWLPQQKIFARLIGHRKKNGLKMVKVKDNSTGEIHLLPAEDKTYKLNYLIKKTFDTIPYFLRHNRFSRAMQNGATLRQVKELKRAKTEQSCYTYLHFSTHEKKKLVRFTNS